MARKSNQNEYVDVYYGIHLDTFEVKNVWVTRGGSMSEGIGHSHYLMPGRDVRSELIIVFSLADAISFHPSQIGTEHAKKAIAELKVKAQAMKAEKDAQLASQNTTTSPGVLE